MAFLTTSQEGDVILLSEAQKLLAEDEELAAVALPATVEQMREKEEDVLVSIMEPLSQLRSRVGGDVLPLMIFMMTHCICRGIQYTAFDDNERWSPYREHASVASVPLPTTIASVRQLVADGDGFGPALMD